MVCEDLLLVLIGTADFNWKLASRYHFFLIILKRMKELHSKQKLFVSDFKFFPPPFTMNNFFCLFWDLKQNRFIETILNSLFIAFVKFILTNDSFCFFIGTKQA